MPIDTFLSGGTGLVGSNILATLAHTSSLRSINAFSRRELQSPSTGNGSDGPTFTPLVDNDTSKWPGMIAPKLSENKGASTIFFSALGTTRAKAGGLNNQRKVDHDLPVSLAEAYAAHTDGKAGTKSVFVLISSAGASTSSMMAYSKMKGETEEAIKALLKPEGSTEGPGLDHVVIVRPGLIVGERRQEDTRPAEFAIRKVAQLTGNMGHWAKDFWAQDADVIAKAAVNAGLQCANGAVHDRVFIVAQSDIVRLGRTEWKD